MNVFVLSTGRCGSMTIARAFAHASNFTAGHDTEAHTLRRLDYPANHVESDSRLAWLLGELEIRYPAARYIWLLRDREEVAQSYAARGGAGLLHFFHSALLGLDDSAWDAPESRLESARRLWDAVNRTIASFLADRDDDRYEATTVDQLPSAIPSLWEWLGVEGDLDAAVAEAGIRHNARAVAV